jgi:cytochrome c oxidase subunit II
VAPEPSASPSGTSIRESYWFIMIFAGIIFFGVEGALIAFIVKYRRGKRPRNQDGLQIHGSTRLEVLWTVVPVVILAVIGTFIFVKLPSIANAPPASAADETTIRVEGRQFYWMFHYPNGAVSVGVMTAPADNVVHEQVFAPDNDVIHSWWVPQLGGKIDAIPGRVNDTWFKAAGGTYPALCGDLCGIQHTMMQAAVTVVPRGDYEKFIAERAANPRRGVCRAGPREQPAAHARQGPDHDPPSGRRPDARRRKRLDGRPDQRAREVHDAAREGSEQWRLTSRRPSPPTAPTGRAVASRRG